MKKINFLVTFAVALFANLAQAQKKDSMSMTTPILSIDDGLITSRFTRTMDSGAKQVLFVSPTPDPSGYTPIKSWIFNKDTIGKRYTDTIKSGLPPAPIKLWVKILHVSAKGDSITETGTVYIQPKAKIPGLSYANTPFNNKGKIVADLLINTNRDGQLLSYTAFNAVDTATAIPNKTWTLTGSPNVQQFKDSSYNAGSSDVWRTYETKNSAGSTKLKWTFIPAYILPAKAETWITYAKDSGNTILNIGGWCITKNLVVNLKLVLGSGDTTYVTIPASNGMSYWKATVVNRIPGKTYTIIAYATNSKGTAPSNSLTHKMPDNPQTLSITSLSYYTDGANLVGKFSFSIPEGKNGNATLDYDTDSSFSFPKDWKTFYNLSGSGNKDGMFTNMEPGTYYLRCQMNDGSISVKKMITVKIHSASTKQTKIHAILVYPNPATDVINSDQPIAIYNTLGEKVAEGSGQIFIGNLPRGLYYYRPFGGNKSFSGKVLLE